MQFAKILLVSFYVGTSSLGLSAQTMNDQELERGRQVLRTLNWITGPQSVSVNNNASLALPPGYMFLNPPDAKRFQELMQKLDRMKAGTSR